MALDIFALIVMGILIAVVVWFVVLLGPMPGRIATDRGHPQPGVGTGTEGARR